MIATPCCYHTYYDKLAYYVSYHKCCHTITVFSLPFECYCFLCYSPYVYVLYQFWYGLTECNTLSTQGCTTVTLPQVLCWTIFYPLYTACHHFVQFVLAMHNKYCIVCNSSVMSKLSITLNNTSLYLFDMYRLLWWLKPLSALGQTRTNLSCMNKWA